MMMITIYEKSKRMEMMEKRKAEEQHKEKSLNGLKKLIQKRCTTIFIGCLDSIEKKFGFQWKEGEYFDNLSEREKLFLQLWKDLRKEILDKGNAQTKSLIAELDYFEVNLKNLKYETKGE